MKNKIIEGYVTQQWETDEEGNDKMVNQFFTTPDTVPVWEDEVGNEIEPLNLYHPYDMENIKESNNG